MLERERKIFETENGLDLTKMEVEQKQNIT